MQRRNGISTRQIDAMVQELFNTGEVISRDHYPNDIAQSITFRKLLARLESEHPGDELIVNIPKRHIRLKRPIQSGWQPTPNYELT